MAAGPVNSMTRTLAELLAEENPELVASAKREADAISVSIDEDTVAWALEQADAIEQGRWDQVDRAAVADELRDIAKAFEFKLYERLVDSARLLARGQSPALESVYHSLEESPSLKERLPDLIKEATRDAERIEKG